MTYSLPLAALAYMFLLVATAVAAEQVTRLKKEGSGFKPMYTEEDLVATCLILEAGGEGRAGMHAVMSVLVNRARIRGTSLWSVIRQPNQFSCFDNVRDEELWRLILKAKDHPNYAQALAFAYGIKTAGMRSWQDSTGGATHYYNPAKARPTWAARLKETKIVGRHRFMYEKGWK